MRMKHNAMGVVSRGTGRGSALHNIVTRSRGNVCVLAPCKAMIRTHHKFSLPCQQDQLVNKIVKQTLGIGSSTH